jgi:hypothetical protein
MKCRNDHNSQKLGTQKEHTSSKNWKQKKSKSKAKKNYMNKDRKASHVEKTQELHNQKQKNES